MIGGRRQMLLMLTLILGVLCMHALILVGTSPTGGGHSVGPGPGAAASGPTHEMPAHASAGTGDATAASPLVHAGSDHSDRGAGHGSTPSAMHHVLHLCLAILAALLVVGAVALALRHTLRPDRPGVPIGALVRRAPCWPPPPTSVRLAQLCVLRN